MKNCKFGFRGERGHSYVTPGINTTYMLPPFRISLSSELQGQRHVRQLSRPGPRLQQHRTGQERSKEEQEDSVE